MPSSPAPLAHRCAALGLDRLSRPSPRAFMPEKGTALDMIKCIAIRHCPTDQIPTFTLQEDPVHRHLRPSPPVLTDHSQLTTSLLPNARWEEFFSEPDHGHSHCSRRHRRSRRGGDHGCFRDHLQDAAQPAVGPLSSRNQQGAGTIMNGAVLDPDEVCPTCQSSAFELPSGSRSEAPVLCGGCQASLGSWSAFRRRVGRVLLLRPACSDYVSGTSAPPAQSRAMLRAG
jgi:hypothetical protein